MNKYNNAYHTSIQIRPVDIKDNTYIDFKKEINDKAPKFKFGGNIRIKNFKIQKNTC